MPKKGSTAKDFRDELWKILFKRAEGFDGRTVAEAFQNASQDVWDAGVDEAWEKLKQPSTAGAKRAFDATWVAATSRRLAKLSKKKSSKQ